MSIKLQVPFAGEMISAIFDSIIEAVEFLVQLKGKTEASKQPATKLSINSDGITVGQKERPLVFLLLVRGAGRDGILTEALVKRLGLKSNRSVGAVVSAVRNAISSVGLGEQEVLRKIKDANGLTRWKAGSRINDAIGALGGEQQLEDRLL